MHVVVAFDKFRGTLTAPEACAAAADAAWEAGVDVDAAPVSDGGEGLLDALGGANRATIVTGPLGAPVEAPWRLHRRAAVIEMALASGLLLAGGAEGNDPTLATTTGTGELIRRALDEGAKHVIVGLGGSATTDGGLGAIEAIGGPHRVRGVEVDVACDVATTFVDAAAVFAPQKGASPAQVALLTARLQQLAGRYEEQYGVDVRDLPRSGAAGGLAGGLAALGARLVSGFDVVAEQIDLAERIVGADLVITGEGHLDAQSLDGKVVGGVLGLAATAGVPVAVVVGDADDDARAAVAATGVRVVTLVERDGIEMATREPKMALTRAVAAVLAAR